MTSLQLHHVFASFKKNTTWQCKWTVNLSHFDWLRDLSEIYFTKVIMTFFKAILNCAIRITFFLFQIWGNIMPDAWQYFMVQSNCIYGKSNAWFVWTNEKWNWDGEIIDIALIFFRFAFFHFFYSKFAAIRLRFRVSAFSFYFFCLPLQSRLL